MKLSKLTILALKGMDKENKERVAGLIGTSIKSFYRHINENKENGELTKARAIQVIGEETGLSQSEILEETVEPVKES